MNNQDHSKDPKYMLVCLMGDQLCWKRIITGLQLGKPTPHLVGQRVARGRLRDRFLAVKFGSGGSLDEAPAKAPARFF